MDLNEIKPNSHTYKEAQAKEVSDVPKTGKVVTGKVVQKSASKKRKFADLFLAEDIGNVKEYLLYDVLVPTLKDTLVRMMESSIQMVFYGRIKSPRTGGSTLGSGIRRYDTMSSSSSLARNPQRVLYDFDDIYLPERAEAQAVLDALNDIIDQYGKVSVGDYYDAVGVSGHGYTDRDYGWTNLQQAYISSTRDGYIINMPRCVDIRRK